MVLRNAMLPGMAATMLTASLAAPNPVQAQDRSVALDLPAGDLDSTLKRIAAATGQQIVYRGDAVRGRRSATVRGRFGAEAAVAQAVIGTGLQVNRTPHGVIVVTSASPAAGFGLPPEDSRDIVVTATKREERLQDIAGSIAAETGQALRRRGATQLQDIIDNTPGLSNPGIGGGNYTNLTIRGVTTGTDLGLKQSTVALLLDDLPIDPLGQGAGTSNLRLVDIERVEVLRGPQGMLFGSGSLAGAVRYVTNKPDFDHAGGSAEATLAATRTGAASYAANAVLNLPVVPGKLALRALGYGYRDGGWVDDLRTGERDVNATITKGGRITLAARPADRWLLTLGAFYQESRDQGGLGGSLYVRPSATGHPGQVTDGLNPNDTLARTAIASATMRYDLPTFSILSSTAYQDRRFRFGGIDHYFAPVTSFLANGTIVDGPTTDLSLVNQKNVTQEVRLTSSAGRPLKWTIGGFYLHSTMLAAQHNRSAAVVPIIGSDNLVDLTAPYRQRELAGFGELGYTLFGTLDITAGVRVSDTRIHSAVTTGGYIPVFSVLPSAYVHTVLDEHDSPVTPRASITWRASPDLSVYAAAARGYRVGGINETTGVGGRDTPPTYGPDSLWNYEAGTKGRAFGGKLTFAADVYYIDWTNLQASLTRAIGNYTGNVGSARLYGLEAQFDARPSPGIAFGAAFSLSRNRVRHGATGLVTPFGVVDARPGDALPASPQAQASGYLEVDFALLGHAAYVRFGGRYLGPEYSSFAKTGTRFGDFATAGLRAGITLKPIELAGFVNNLFDGAGATGAADASMIGPVTIQSQTAYRIRPRTIGLTARASF